jgi:hypothetical protein
VELALVVTGKHAKLLTEAPKTQQANAKLAMYTHTFAARKSSLHRITKVRGNVFKVGPSILVQQHTVAVVSDFQHDLASRSSANDVNVLRSRINRILDQLADSFERMRL